jgi:hypothetical protein
MNNCDFVLEKVTRLAGHSSVAISGRYVHPSEDAVLSAMSRLGGHKTGHTVDLEDGETVSKIALSDEVAED